MMLISLTEKIVRSFSDVTVGTFSESTEICFARQKQGKVGKRFFKRVGVGFGLASTILLGVGWVSYRNLNNLIEHAEVHFRSHNALEKIQNIRADMQQAAIAKHRYVTTGELSYLEPYYDVVKAVQIHIDQFRQLIDKAPQQQRRLAILIPLINQKFAETKETSEIRRLHGFNAATHPLIVGKAKKLTNDTEAILREMQIAEEQASKLQSRLAKSDALTTLAVFLSGILLTFLILACVCYFIHRELGERQQAETALKQSESTLRSFFDSTSMMMGLVELVDEDVLHISDNAAAAKFVGLTPEAMKNCLASKMPKNLLRNWIHYFREADRYQLPVRFEYTQDTNKGQRWLSATVSSIPVSLGNRPRFAYVVEDITERKLVMAELRESEERWQLALYGNKDGIWDHDLRNNKQFLSARCLEIFGYFGNEVDNFSKWFEFVHPEDRDAVLSAFQAHLNHQTPHYTAEYRVRCADGHYKWILSRGQALWDEAGTPIRAVGSITDISDRKMAEAKLQQANEKLLNWVKELEQHNHELALLSEMNEILQTCLSVDEACKVLAQLVQTLFPEVSGRIFLISSRKNLVETVAAWGIPSLEPKLFTPHECWALRLGKTHLVSNVHDGLRCQHLDDPFPAESICIPMMAQGEALGMLYLSSQESGRLTETKQQLAVTVAENIALSLANLKLRESLQNQNIRDPLTGLFNRRHLEECLEREMQRCADLKQPLSLIMTDVDHFKHFNDTFGHRAGDAVLQKLGLFLQNFIRKSDIACRYGGEELILILPETPLEIAYQRAESIRENTKQLQVQYNRQQLDAVTLSMGVACFPQHGLTGDAVLRAADAALYNAKALGRDRVIASS